MEGEEVDDDKSKVVEDTSSPSKLSLAVKGGDKNYVLIDESVVALNNVLMRMVPVLIDIMSSPTLREDCMPIINDWTAL